MVKPTFWRFGLDLNVTFWRFGLNSHITTIAALPHAHFFSHKIHTKYAHIFRFITLIKWELNTKTRKKSRTKTGEDRMEERRKLSLSKGTIPVGRSSLSRYQKDPVLFSAWGHKTIPRKRSNNGSPFRFLPFSLPLSLSRLASYQCKSDRDVPIPIRT